MVLKDWGALELDGWDLLSTSICSWITPCCILPNLVVNIRRLRSRNNSCSAELVTLLLVQSVIDLSPAVPSGVHPEGETHHPLPLTSYGCIYSPFLDKVVEGTPYLHPETH